MIIVYLHTDFLHQSDKVNEDAFTLCDMSLINSGYTLLDFEVQHQRTSSKLSKWNREGHTIIILISSPCYMDIFFRILNNALSCFQHSYFYTDCPILVLSQLHLKSSKSCHVMYIYTQNYFIRSQLIVCQFSDALEDFHSINL